MSNTEPCVITDGKERQRGQRGTTTRLVADMAAAAKAECCRNPEIQSAAKR
jgi:hypothetical protein